MSTQATRPLLKLLSLLPATLALCSQSALAQTPEPAPLGIYGGAAFGIGVYDQKCGVSCDRATFSGKLFGGKRITPNLAAEVNYFAFGGVNRAFDNQQAAVTGVSEERRKFRALTLGINWEVELPHGFTNHIRVGVAHGRFEDDVLRTDGTTTRVRDRENSPYLGVGLSYQLTRDLRLLSTADWIINGGRHVWLLGVGGSAEF